MPSQNILMYLELIQKTQGTNDKKALLQEWYDIDSSQCIKVMNFLYNPNIVTNMSTKKIKKIFIEPILSTSDVKILDDNVLMVIMMYLVDECTGTDENIRVLQSYRDLYTYLQSKEFLELFMCKELAIGLDIKAINSVIPNCISIIEPMLATNYVNVADKLDHSKIYYITLKLDGNRCIVDNRTGTPKAYSRNGVEIKGLDTFLNCLKLPSGKIYDGELLPRITTNKSSKDQYKEISSIMRTKGEKPKDKITYHIFDIIDYNLPYIRRRDFIDSIEDSEYQLVCKVLYKGQLNGTVFKLLDEIVSLGQEGLMANDIYGLYESKRVKSILKFKKFNTVDLKCIDVEQGEKKYANTLGAIICEYKGNTVKVGSGFTDSQRDYYWNNQDEIVGRVVEIQYFEETQDKQGKLSCRFPTFICCREIGKEVSYN
ncbi:putative ATP dependent DNA ligase domain protein [Fusobacterium phage vB_FnuS_FNU2]|nr:putative ATP dependent DNA ligase domain protein [Fusobacterium phage vB_FnuS_FNU2]